MPHVMLPLCDRMGSALESIAKELASKSQFVRATTLPFHVPLLGSLHSHGASEIAAALNSVSARAAPLAGRCLRWDLTRRSLRLLVALEGDESIEAALHKRLTRAKTWRPRAITVGSIEQMEQTQHAAFLSAVEAAFPIVDASTFVCATLANSEHPEAAVTLRGNKTTGGASSAGGGAPDAAAGTSRVSQSHAKQPSTSRPSGCAKKNAASASRSTGPAVPMDVESRLVGIKKQRKGRSRGGGGGGRG